VANNDFLRVGGKDVDGTLLPAGPVLVAEQLPASNPVRKSALEYIHAYEGAYGKGSVSTFGGHVWDAGKVLAAAVPAALKGAQPGTEAFRSPCATPRGQGRGWRARHSTCRRKTTWGWTSAARDGQDRERQVGLSAEQNGRRRP
jgi:hypothetical protein